MSESVISETRQQQIKTVIEAALLEVPEGERDAAVGYVMGFCLGFVAKRIGLNIEGAHAFVQDTLLVVQRRIIDAGTRAFAGKSHN